MRYELNDLLDDGLVEALTADTFAGKRPGARLWRRGLALAACGLLAVGLLNFEAIAAGTQRLWQYIAGVGAVEVESTVLVQGEDIVWMLDDRKYNVSGAYEKDGVLTLHVRLYTEQLIKGDAWFDIVLLENGKPCQTVWGHDAERSETPFTQSAEWEAAEDLWGYVMPEAYAATGSFAGTNPSFYTEGSGTYTVQIWAKGAHGERWGEPLSAELRLRTPESQAFEAHTMAQDGGVLTALVSEDGRRISFYLEGAKENLSLRCPYHVWFVDEAGERYRGAMVSGPANLPAQSVEVRLETVPQAPIVSIEVGALLLSKEDSIGRFLGYEERPSLNWIIPVT